MEAIVQILAQTQAKPTMSRDKRINHEEEQKTVELGSIHIWKSFK
jgi:hypothetical protein